MSFGDLDGHEDGAVIGAEIGTLIEPGGGTAVGAAIGGLIDIAMATYFVSKAAPEQTFTEGQTVVLPDGEAVTAQDPLGLHNSNIPPPPLPTTNPGNTTTVDTSTPAFTSQAGTVDTTVTQTKRAVPLSERDEKRYFTPSERDTLKARAKGRCETCGRKTTRSEPYRKGSSHSPREGQAGHKKSWSKGGRTNLKNGKWQCKGCNQKEGANSK